MPSSLADDVNQRARATYGVVPNLFAAMAEHTGMPGAVYLARVLPEADPMRALIGATCESCEKRG